MRKTYCKAHMFFADTTASSDCTVSTNGNQFVANASLLTEEKDSLDYATFEKNQFVLDGSKNIMPDEPNNLAFISQNISDNNGLFETNPLVVFDFTTPHTSAGITLDFGVEYPKHIKITWLSLNNEKIAAEDFFPESTRFVCKKQVELYRKITVEFIQTRLPGRFATLQSILFGLEIEWSGADLKSAKIVENVDVTSATLAINTASVSIIDKNNDFDIENDNGTWKSVQKAQEVVLTEYINDAAVPCGVFFINEKSFSGNIASFELIDRIGLMDNYLYDKGEMYEDKQIGEIIEDIFAFANVTDYEISPDVYSVTVSGTLGIQTCREALQMCCFVVGAVADDSRSGTVKVFYPDRYLSSTIQTARKFYGGTSVELKEYVSGISITSNKYRLENETSNIYEDVLQKGDNRIEFADPYKPDTITVSAGVIKDAKTHYVVVTMPETAVCSIDGKKYEAYSFSTVVSDEIIEPNEIVNVKSFGDFTLHNSDVLTETAKKLLSYYRLRKKVNLRYIVDREQSGDWVGIVNVKNSTSATLIESQDIDLVGGFLSTAVCCGYSIVITDYQFAGNELYAGGDFL